jgi:DNA-binding SARP family transcriptional activator/tetratricopeptide (TPR) repeat protein
MFRLKLLGGALIEGPAGPMSGRVAQRRRLALLACVAASRGRPISRDKLMALLWPEADPDRARHLLSDSIYLIRKELGDAAVVTAGADLRLDQSVISSDVAEFEQALLEGRLEEAAILYRGPFLDGFHIDDAPEFEHWLDAERERLTRSCARLLETLAQERESAGDFAGAAEWWRRLAAYEPASGRVALRVMRALDAAGDRAGAIQHARTHTLLLREQFDIDADAEVTTLADRLRTGDIPRSSPARQGTPGPRTHAPEPEPALTPRTLQPDSTNAVAADTASADLRHGSAPAPAPRSRRRAQPMVLLSMIGAIAILVIGWPLTRPTGRDVILVADAARDTVLGDFVTERLRQVLARSPQLSVMGRPAIDATLQRMGRGAQLRLVPEIAREVAMREGLKAFVRVDILTSGDAHYLSAALVSAENGELLDSDGVMAPNATAVVAATDQLTEAVRRRFPRTIESMEGRDRLYPVTTDSIRALLKYMEGFLAYRLQGDVLRAIELADEAIAIDPAFAQAYLHLYFYLGAQGTDDRRAQGALLEAFRLRDRLSLYERNVVEAEYFLRVEGDFARAVDRYRAHILEAKKFGRNQVIVSFLGLARVHVLLGDLDQAERVLQESRTWFPGPFNQTLLVRVLYSLEREAEARAVLAEATDRFPDNAWPRIARAHLAAAAGDYTQAHMLALRVDAPSDVPFAIRTAALFDAVQGRFTEAASHLRDLQAQLLEARLTGAAFEAAAAAAQFRLIAGDTLEAVREVEELVARQPLDSVGAWGQPALLMARFFARANQPQRATELLAAYERSLPRALAKADPWPLRQARAALALANRDPDRAVAELRPRHLNLPRNDWFEEPLIPLDSRPELARAWEQAGQPDSAIAVYERYVGARALFRAEMDAFELAGAYERLAVLHENRNDLRRAADYHRRMAALWRSADPKLRQRAEAAMRRAVALEGRSANRAP